MAGIPASDFQLSRFSKLILTAHRMAEIERSTGAPSGVIYIYDCERAWFTCGCRTA